MFRNVAMRLLNLKHRFAKLETTHFCDASDTVKLFSGHLHQYAPGFKMVGLAHTVESQGDLLPVIKALKEAQPGEILVINSGGSSYALAGEMFATEAKRKSLAGIMIDGFCRDVDAIKQLGFPFYAKGICARAGTKSKLGSTQIPILFDGITVNPGNVIFGDENGVVLVEHKDFEEILSVAEQIRDKEEQAIQAMKKGGSLIDMLNFENTIKMFQKEERAHYALNKV